jgi:hypothetical protein
MARTLHAYLAADRMPDCPTLQAAIRAQGFKLVLDDAYAPFAHQGYLPCTLEGEDAGVYLTWEREAALPDVASALRAEQGARTDLMRLKWGGDAREEMSAMVIAAVLVLAFDALVLEPDQGVPQAGDALLKRARRLQAENF